MSAPWQENTTPSQFIFNFLHKNVLGESVLDIGCAQGWYIKDLKDKGHKVQAVDLEKHILFKDVPFTCASITSLPFPDKSFDTVLVINVLEHVEDEAQALSELKRVARQRVIFSVPNGRDEVLRKYNLTFAHFTDRTHERVYDANNFKNLLEGLGFSVKRVVLGGPVIPSLFSEFFPISFGKVFNRKIINRLFKAGLLKNSALQADIFVVADIPST